MEIQGTLVETKISSEITPFHNFRDIHKLLSAKFDYFLNCDYGCIFLEEGLQSLTKHFAKKTLMSTFA